MLSCNDRNSLVCKARFTKTIVEAQECTILSACNTVLVKIFSNDYKLQQQEYIGQDHVPVDQVLLAINKFHKFTASLFQ